jgi:hypothetical protein
MISKLIVEKFDGTITFESEYGKGSTFCFSFKIESYNVEKELENLDKMHDKSIYLNQLDLAFKWKPHMDSKSI